MKRWFIRYMTANTRSESDAFASIMSAVIIFSAPTLQSRVLLAIAFVAAMAALKFIAGSMDK